MRCGHCDLTRCMLSEAMKTARCAASFIRRPTTEWRICQRRCCGTGGSTRCAGWQDSRRWRQRGAAVDMGAEALRFNRRFYVHSAMPSDLVITTDNNANPYEIERLMEIWDTRPGGSG